MVIRFSSRSNKWLTSLSTIIIFEHDTLEKCGQSVHVQLFLVRFRWRSCLWSHLLTSKNILSFTYKNPSTNVVLITYIIFVEYSEYQRGKFTWIALREKLFINFNETLGECERICIWAGWICGGRNACEVDHLRWLRNTNGHQQRRIPNGSSDRRIGYGGRVDIIYGELKGKIENGGKTEKTKLQIMFNSFQLFSIN